jgi:hypothetical protein
MFGVGDKVMVLDPGRRYPNYVPLFDRLGLINLTDEHYTDLYLEYNNGYSTAINNIMVENYNMSDKVEKYSIWNVVKTTGHNEYSAIMVWLQNNDGVNVVMNLEGLEKVGLTPIKVLRPHKLATS